MSSQQVPRWAIGGGVLLVLALVGMCSSRRKAARHAASEAAEPEPAPKPKAKTEAASTSGTGVYAKWLRATIDNPDADAGASKTIETESVRYKIEQPKCPGMTLSFEKVKMASWQVSSMEAECDPAVVLGPLEEQYGVETNPHPEIFRRRWYVVKVGPMNNTIVMVDFHDGKRSQWFALSDARVCRDTIGLPFLKKLKASGAVFSCVGHLVND